MAIDLAGVFPPLTTPFDVSGRLDLSSFRRNLRDYNRFRFRGYLVLGSSGEAASLLFEERVKLIEAARRETGKEKLLLVGTGAQSFQETLKLTQVAASVSADAALVLSPFYYKPAMTSEILSKFYRKLARAARLPILIYSIPQFTGFQMGVPLLAELSRKPNIIGLKESSGNISYLSEIIEATGRRFQCLTGSALTFMPSLTLGTVGGILAIANVAPQECIEIYEDFKAGKLKDAALKQRKIMKLARAVTAGFGVAGLKACITLAGFHGGYPRSPLQPLPPDGRAVIRKLFEEMKANW
jgi:4-hydroxy-2-oxoglutarate aldolase